MPGILEAVNFSHLITSFEVYERLANLDERIAIRWLMPSKPGSPEFGLGTIRYRVWVRPKNSTNTKILGGGHLVRAMHSLSVFCLGPNQIKTKTDSSRKTAGAGYVNFSFGCILFSDSERYTSR